MSIRRRLLVFASLIVVATFAAGAQQKRAGQRPHHLGDDRDPRARASGAAHRLRAQQQGDAALEQVAGSLHPELAQVMIHVLVDEASPVGVRQGPEGGMRHQPV